MQYVECEVWVKVSEDGQWDVGPDAETCASNYRSSVDEDGTLACRMVKLTVRVPVPKPIEATVTCPEEPQGADVSVS